MDQEKYQKAKKKVKDKKSFFQHLASYAIVNTFFFLLALTGRMPFQAALMPLFGWGIGVMFHYVNVFGIPGIGGFLSKDWEEEEIKKEYHKMNREEDSLELKELQKERNRWKDDEIV